MPKKVQINFALKTPEELAERLGVSKTRLARLVTIVEGRKAGAGSVHVAFRKSRTANSRSARRNNAKTAR
jgi:hypothetical protein